MLLRTAAIFMMTSVLAVIAASAAPQRSSPPEGGSAPTASAAIPNDVYPDSLSRLPLVKRDDLDAAGKKIYDAVANGPGRPVEGLQGPYGVWLYSPRVAEHIQPINYFLRHESDLGPRLAELVILVVARELDSQFQWTNHEPQALKEGLEAATIDIVRARKSAQGLGDKEALIITMGREAFENRKINSGTFVRVEKAFGRRGLVHLAGLMADTVWAASMVRAFDIQLRPGQKPLLTPCCDRPPSAPRRPMTAIPDSEELPADIDPESRFRWNVIQRETLDERAQKAYDMVVDPATGTKSGLRGPAGLWIYTPPMAEHTRPLNNFLRYQTGFDLRLTELAIMAMAREMNAVYEWNAHVPIALKAGLEQQIIDVVQYRKGLEGLGEKEAAIISFGRELAREKKVSSPTFARVRKLFGDRELVNLASLMGSYAGTSIVIRTFDYQLPPGPKSHLPLP